jgi:hypothetical protein
MPAKLADLLDNVEPAWPDVERWIKAAKNQVEVLPADRARSDATLVALQVTTRLPIGAIAWKTGGLYVGGGWVRMFGGGCDRLPHGLASWNGLGGMAGADPRPDGFLVVGCDLSGGFFAINGGALKGAKGNVLYYSPERLTWQDLGRSYSHFLVWLFAIDLQPIYQNRRWPGWEADAAAAPGDQAFLIDPPLSVPGPPIAERGHTLAPLTDLWRGYFQRR